MREAIILSGGLGTRLKSLFSDIPKPMAPINGTPFIELLIRFLILHNFQRVILSLYYMSDVIIHHLDNLNLDIEIIYCVDKSKLGTGGAIKHALQHCLSNKVYILNGDSFIDLDFDALECKFQNTQSSLIVTSYTYNTGRYGVLNIENELIKSYEQSAPPGNSYISLGMYYLDCNLLDKFTSNTFSFESDYLAKEDQISSFTYYQHNGIFIDIGIPEDYQRAQKLLANYC